MSWESELMLDVSRRGREIADRLLPQPTVSQRVLIVDGMPVPYFPRNWYHSGWYATLESFQKPDLLAADVEDLPDIVSLDSIKRFINAHVLIERNS